MRVLTMPKKLPKQVPDPAKGGATEQVRFPLDLGEMMREIQEAEHYDRIADLVDEMFRAAILQRFQAAQPFIIQMRKVKERKRSAGEKQ